PEHTRHTITEEGADGLLTAARPMDSDGWAALPTELVACVDLTYVYVITKASAGEGQQEVGVGSEVEEMEEGTCDRCVIGRWQLDTMSHWEAFLSVLPSEMSTR